MVVLEDGTVLVAGDLSPDPSNRPDSEIFNPASGRWQITGQMSRPRGGHSLTLLSDGTVLAVGGLDTEARQTAERFDPSRQSWRLTAPPLSPRWQHEAVRLKDGRVLVIGGKGPGQDTIDEALATVEVYSYH